MADRSIAVSLLLKVRDALSEASGAKEKLKSEFGQIQGAANIKPKIDTTAVETVKSEIGKLSQTLADLKERQFSLGKIEDIRANQAAIAGVEKEVGTLSGTLKGLESASKGESPKWIKQAGNDAVEASHKAESAEGTFSELKRVTLGVFGGNALASGAHEIGESLKDIFESGQKALEQEEKLTVAFKGNAKEAKEAADYADVLGSKYAVLPEHLREISANAAIVGNATGKFNKDLTELSAGFEKLNIPGVDATNVIKAFTAGAGDPEGAAGLGRLTMQFPILATGLANITDPAEKAKKALELMGPQFAILQEQAQGSANAGVQVQIAVEKLKEGVGKVLYTVLATYIMPPLKLVVGALSDLAGWFNDLSGPGKTVVDVLGGIAVAFAVVTGATAAFNAVKESEMLIRARGVIVDNAEKVAKIALIPVQIATTVAQEGLNAAMSANPIGVIILAIVALVGLLEGLAKAVGLNGNLWENLVGIIKAVGSAIWAFIQNYVSSVIKAFEGVGKVIHGLMHLDFSEMIAGAKQVGTSVVDAVAGSAVKAQGAFVKSVGDTNKSLKDQSDAAKSAGEAGEAGAQKAAQAQKDLTAQIQKSNSAYQDQEKGAKQGVDDSVTRLATLRRALGELQATGSTTLDGFHYSLKDGVDRVKQFQDAIDQTIKSGKAWEEQNRTNEKRDKQASEDIVGKDTEDPTKKTGAQTKSLQQQIESFIKYQQAMAATANLELKDGTKTQLEQSAKNLDAKKSELEGMRVAREAWIKGNVKDHEKMNAMLANLSAEQVEAQDKLEQAAQAQRQKEFDLRAKAGLGEEESVQAKLAAIQKKYRDQEKALTEIVKEGVASEEEAAAARVTHALAEEKEIYAVRKDAADKKLALRMDTLKKEFEAQQQSVAATAETHGVSHYAVEEGNLRRYAAVRKSIVEQQLADDIKAATESISDEALRTATVLKLQTDAATQKQAINAETEQQIDQVAQKRIDTVKQRATDELAFEVATRKLKKDSLDFTLQNLSIAEQAERDALALKYKDHDEYEQQLAILEGKYAGARADALKADLERNNIAYQAAAKGIESVFGDMTSEIESGLGQMFGYEKSQMQSMTDNDKRLAELDKNDQIANLAQQVSQNKISYQKYTLEKVKAEEDYNKKIGGNQAKQLSLTREFEKQMTQTVVTELAKRGQTYFLDAISDIATGQAKASSNFIASVFSTMPWFVAIPIIAAGLAGIGALFATIMPKGADNGLVHIPGRDDMPGMKGQLIAIGETGKKEFVSPDDTAHDYLAHDLGPRVYKTALAHGAAQARSVHAARDFAMYQSGSILPRVAPHVAPGYQAHTQSSGIDHQHMTAFNETLKHVVDKGITIESKSRISGEHLEMVGRVNTKTVKQAGFVTGGGLR